jgi:hypothetical protein
LNEGQKDFSPSQWNEVQWGLTRPSASVVGPKIPMGFGFLHVDVDLLGVEQGWRGAGLQVHGFGHVGQAVLVGRWGQEVLLCHKPHQGARQHERVEGGQADAGV